MILLWAILRSRFSFKQLNFSSFFSLKYVWRGLYPLFTGITPSLIQLCLIGPGICFSQKIGLKLVLGLPDPMIWWPVDHWCCLDWSFIFPLYWWVSSPLWAKACKLLKFSDFLSLIALHSTCILGISLSPKAFLWICEVNTNLSNFLYEYKVNHVPFPY